MFAVLSLAAALAASPAADPAFAQPTRVRICPDDAGFEHAKKRTPTNPPKIRKSKLGDLPKPDMELTVLRKVNGCTTPVKVRTGVQGDGSFANPQIDSDIVPTDRTPAPDADAPQDAAEE